VGMEHRDRSPPLAAGPGEDQMLDDGVVSFANETPGPGSRSWSPAVRLRASLRGA
jgi:hypothetical protein